MKINILNSNSNSNNFTSRNPQLKKRSLDEIKVSFKLKYNNTIDFDSETIEQIRQKAKELYPELVV